MSENVLTLTPGGQAIATSLGFGARSVIVDNFTSDYVDLPDTGKAPIPPWVYGAVVSLPMGTNKARASLIPTSPAVPGPPVPTIQATLTWTDVPLPANPGHLLQQPSSNPRIKLYPDGTPLSSQGDGKPSFVATHATSTTKTLTLGASTTNLRIILVDAVSGAPKHAGIQVVGHNTGAAFQPTSSILTHLNLTKPVDIRVDPEIDAQVDVTIDVTTTSPTDDVNVFVSQLLGAETTMLNAVADVPLPVQTRQYDWQQTTSVSGSGTPTLTLAGFGQELLIIDTIQVSLMCISGAGNTPLVKVVTALPALLWQQWMACQSSASAAAVDRISEVGMGLRDNVANDSPSLEFDRAIGANEFVSMFWGGYFL